MSKYIPFYFNKPIHPLFPGCNINFEHLQSNNRDFKILYVGGIDNIFYNLKMSLTCIAKFKEFKMTICCREDGWNNIRDEYLPIMNDNISILHEHDTMLANLFKEADLFNIFVEPIKYREFAVPYKLFEAIGYGISIIASNGTWVANFVRNNNIGFTCDYNFNSLENTLKQIIQSPLLLNRYRDNIRLLAKKYSWNMTAKRIVKTINRICI
jgi:glycosyltransferase involved in cell wall biosynthesis